MVAIESGQGAIWSLERLIHPLDDGTFVDSHWGRKYLHVRRDKPRYFTDLVTIDDIDHILAMSGARPPRVRLVSSGKVTPPEHLVSPGALPAGPSIDSLIGQVRGGSTVALHFIQEILPKLNDLCESLRIELSCAAQVNAYITPPHSQGLNPHPDSHDVLVAQVFGRKNWRLYKDDDLRGDGDPLDAFVLHPGDLLYLPQGQVHVASTDDDFSIHLTIGLSTLSVGDLLLLEVGRIVRDEELAERIPPRLLEDDSGEQHLYASLKEAIERVLCQFDADAVVSDARRQLERVQRADARGRLAHLLSPLPSEASHFQLQDGCTVHVGTDGAVVARNGFEVCLPPAANAAVQVMAERSVFSGAGLPLDAASRRVVIERLLDEGMLKVRD